MLIISLVIAVLVVLDINFCTRLSLNSIPDIRTVSPNCHETRDLTQYIQGLSSYSQLEVWNKLVSR